MCLLLVMRFMVLHENGLEDREKLLTCILIVDFLEKLAV